MQTDPSFRRGAALGFGTGFPAAIIAVLLVAGFAFGMFDLQKWYLFTPAIFFLGWGRRGFLRGLLISAAVTLSLNLVVWAISHGTHR